MENKTILIFTDGLEARVPDFVRVAVAKVVVEVEVEGICTHLSFCSTLDNSSLIDIDSYTTKDGT